MAEIKLPKLQNLKSENGLPKVSGLKSSPLLKTSALKNNSSPAETPVPSADPNLQKPKENTTQSAEKHVSTPALKLHPAAEKKTPQIVAPAKTEFKASRPALSPIAQPAKLPSAPVVPVVETPAHQTPAPQVAQAPVAEAPAPQVAQAPVAEAPASQVAQAPVAEAPAPQVAQAPVAEAPAPQVAQAPVAEAPASQVAQAPVAEAPASQVAQAPIAEASAPQVAQAPVAPVAEVQEPQLAQAPVAETAYPQAADAQNMPAENTPSAQPRTSGVFPAPSGVFGETDLQHGTIEKFGAQEDEEISGKYDVGECVGRGGCAVVLEAWRKTDRMHVVIKVLQVTSGLDDSQETRVAVKRFYREAELIASLKEEHIVQCIDYGRYQGTPCMVLEFIEGLSLDRLLQNYGALPLAFATNIIEQLLSALVETHEKNIIHRDIKPGNIMVFDTPPPYEIRVLDFGISTVLDNLQSQTLMTQQGNVRGTPSYMAPELFTGETRASIESDLYAVGLVYLECLTGEVAVNDKSFMRVAYKQVNEELEIPLFIPTSISDIIKKCCKKKKDERYHTAQDVLDDIHKCLPQALKDEDKFLKIYQKAQKKNAKNKNHSNAHLHHTTANKRLKSFWSFVIIAVAMIAVCVCMLIIVLNDNSSQPQNTQDTNLTNTVEAAPAAPVEPPKSPEDLKAERAKKLALETIKVSSKVHSAWLSAELDLNDELKKIEEEEKAKAEKKKQRRGRHRSNKIQDPGSAIDLSFMQ